MFFDLLIFRVTRREQNNKDLKSVNFFIQPALSCNVGSLTSHMISLERGTIVVICFLVTCIGWETLHRVLCSG